MHVVTPPQTSFRYILETLRNKVPGTQAVILAGPEAILDFVQENPALDIEGVAGEYATMLRIAERTSEDIGGGNLVEHIVVSEKYVVIARSISRHHFLVLLLAAQDQIGRARYELKQAAFQFQTQSITT
jgi:predicted regulator of Ras-like GTPase activity (Roadblock/LC7/MglB family)